MIYRRCCASRNRVNKFSWHFLAYLYLFVGNVDREDVLMVKSIHCVFLQFESLCSFY